jgi:hypothetical protein
VPLPSLYEAAAILDLYTRLLFFAHAQHRHTQRCTSHQPRTCSVGHCPTQATAPTVLPGTHL